MGLAEWRRQHRLYGKGLLVAGGGKGHLEALPQATLVQGAQERPVLVVAQLQVLDVGAVHEVAHVHVLRWAAGVGLLKRHGGCWLLLLVVLLLRLLLLVVFLLAVLLEEDGLWKKWKPTNDGA